MPRKSKRLKTFNCSYAYDVPHYAEFSVRASSERQAEAMIKKALKEKRFKNVEGAEAFANVCHERVFVVDAVSPEFASEPMEQAIKESDARNK